MKGFAVGLAALRIDNRVSALLLCGAASAFIGSCAFAFGMAVEGWNQTDQLGLAISRIIPGTLLAFILIFPASLALALPVTWLAQRLRIESLALYLVTATLAGAACAVALLGWPRPSEFGFQGILRLSGPFFGGSWGLFWWFTHRRWKTSPKALPRESGI